MQEKTKQPATRSKPWSWIKRIFVFLLLVFILIQFFQPKKNNNDFSLRSDISTVVPVPDSVGRLLKNACYDCHSNNTEYPWYSSIQPVAWWLHHHIEEGKRHLNFSEFALMTGKNGRSVKERQMKKLDEIKENIEKDEMPLDSYLWMHKEARLSKTDKEIFLNWVDGAKKQLAAGVEK